MTGTRKTGAHFFVRSGCGCPGATPDVWKYMTLPGAKVVLWDPLGGNTEERYLKTTEHYAFETP